MSITRFLPIFALIATLGSPLAAGAQTTASPVPVPAASGAPAMGHAHHRHHRDSLMRALRSVNLTDAQKQQVTTFRTQFQQANTNADPATKRANAAKLHDQIMGILTPDQKTQVTAAMHHPHGRHGAGPSTMDSPSPAPSPATR